MMSRSDVCRLVAASAVLIVVLAGSLPRGVRGQESVGKRIENQEKELRRIKQKIDDHRRKSRALAKEEKTAIKKLSDLDREIDLIQSYVRELQSHEELLEIRIDSLRSAFDAQSQRLEAQKRVLAKRLRQMYKRDPHHRFDVILGSSSVEQAMTRYKFMQIIAEQDAELIASFRDSKHQLEVETAALTESLSEIATLRQQREAQSAALESSRKKRRSMLSRIRTEKVQHTKAIEQLEKAQGEVKDLLGALERKRLEQQQKGIIDSGDFARLKGKLAWPVQGKVHRRYGKIKHPKYGTVTFNNGIDIKAPAGAPIIAVASGVVEFVDWIDAYGKCLIVNHGDGYYTLYAHVANTFVAQGKKVIAGDVIAEVGDTGSLDGYSCHFEIRKAKQALNPLQWLRPDKKSS